MNKDQSTTSEVSVDDTAAEMATMRDADLLQKLIVIGDNWIWETDAEHCAIRFSDNVERITGVSADDLIGSSHINFVKELAETDSSAEAHLEDLLAYRAFSNFEYDVPDADPGYSRMSISGIPVFVDGVFKGYRGTGRNVSGLLHSQQDQTPETAAAVTGEGELQEAKSRYEEILNSVPAGILVFDENDEFVFCNRAVKDALPEMAPAMQPGKSLRMSLELAHDVGYLGISGDDELDELYRTDREAWIEQYSRRYHVEQEIRERQNPDGSWVQTIDTRTEDGTYIGVRLDISEQKKREQEAAAATARLQIAIDAMKDGFVVWDKDDRLVVCNEAFKSQAPAQMEVATGRTYCELLVDLAASGAVTDAVGREEQWVEDLLDKREEELGQEIVFETHDGRWIMRRDQETETGERVGIRADITDVKRSEIALEQAQLKAELADRAKSEFLANMSHEIRTPMNGVLGMTELLAKSNLDSKQRTFTDIIVKSGNALLTIINDILDFSKIDAGQLELDPAPFKLAEAIEDVATLVSTRAKEKDLELIVRVEPGLSENMIGDVGRIRQIITNLMGNAVKFTEKGHVLVEVTGDDLGASTRLKIAVTDTGIGIPEDQLSTIFEKFSQVDASSTRRHEGTGLGLTITSKLVDLMGGNVGAESVMGDGSTFWFEIELQNSGSQSNKKVAPVDVTGAKVLIIDDNAVNRSILLEQTASWSFDSCAAESGEVGLMVLEAALQQDLQVECVILDFQMPGMTGFDVARAVRSHGELHDTPIVMLTSVDQALSTREYRELGINAHLVKPARSSQLLETLVETIQAHRAVDDDESADEHIETNQLADPVATDTANAPFAHDELEDDLAEPAEIAAQSLAFVDPAEDDHEDIGHIDILVAEDNDVNQIVFTQILEETGYRYKIVGNGKLAVDAIDELAPSIILMDVSMPEMNGLEATSVIRESEEGTDRHIPIIGVTAHALKGDRERCVEAGMDDYLSKPISPDALHGKIAKWLVEGEAEKSNSG